MDELEIVIEPGVVPKGTFDPKSLDAPAGAAAPSVRASSKGPVVPLGEKTRLGQPAVKREPQPAALVASDLRSSSDDVAALAAVDRAASAPLPPRPASADGPSAAAQPAEARAQEFFDTDLDSPVASVLALLKLLVYVAFMGLVLFVIYIWLSNRRADTVAEEGSTQPETALVTEPETTEPETTDPAETTEPETTEPETTDPAETTEPETTEPETTDPAETTEPETTEPERDPQLARDAAEAADQLALDALRVLVSEAQTGGRVGVEEDSPGLVAEVEGLRAAAMSALKAGDYAAARQALQALLEKSPRDADATFRLGLVGHREGDWEAAEASYQRATELAPDDPRPLNNLALIALQRKDTARAKEHLAAARRRAPHDPDVLTNLARLSEDPDEALALYAQALEARPDHGPARLGRARLRAARGDYPGAHGDLEVLLAEGAPYRAQALDTLGVLARRQGDLVGAEKLHREAAQSTPPAPEARVHLGLVLIDTQRAREAATLLEGEVKRHPTSAQAWLALGIARTRLADDSPPLLYEAKTAYERSLELDDANWATHHNYALCAERFGNYLFAMQQYERAIELQPDEGAPYANLARLLHRGGQGEKALKLLERGQTQVPQDPELAYQRAYLLAELGRNIEARDSLRRFIELAPADDPRLPEAHRGLGGDGG
ncbi:MAG: tetratricopeptide repeat protein [Planctomycetota bacterium]